MYEVFNVIIRNEKYFSFEKNDPDSSYIYDDTLLSNNIIYTYILMVKCSKLM